VHFVVSSGTSIFEISERCDGPGAALDRTLALLARKRPNVRVFDEGGRRVALADLGRAAGRPAAGRGGEPS
jgi:orotate phosphoribosyltransferase